MTNPALEEFRKYKKSQGQFISLTGDNEEITVKIKDMKTVTKTGFGGAEVVVLRLVVETLEGTTKFFDNGQTKWADELENKKVKVGDLITIVRHGEKGNAKTTYEITHIEEE